MIIVFFSFQEGHWVWENSGISATFLNWAPSEPQNHGGNEDCARIDAQKRKWYDVPCYWAQAKPICHILI